MEVHPAIKALEAAGQPTSEIVGYIGEAGQGIVRLYADFGLSRWVEIPEAGIVHIEPIAGETGRARVFVRADQMVREVAQRHVAAARALAVQAFPPDDRFPEPERGGLLGCYGRCESVFAAQAAMVVELKNRASLACSEGGVDSPRCRDLSNQAATLEAQSVGFLHDCLTACQAAQRFHSVLFPPRPVNEIVAEFVKKYLA